MKKLLILVCCLFQSIVHSQTDNSTIFERISQTMETFEIDTTAVPNDKLSNKIKELRSLKGGFNINEAMEYKLAEARTKNELPEEEYQELNTFLTKGNGKKWLDNSIIWIYRKTFTYQEVKQMIKFYKTSAGKKMATDFPIIMVQSVKAAETIMENYKKKE